MIGWFIEGELDPGAQYVVQTADMVLCEDNEEMYDYVHQPYEDPYWDCLMENYYAYEVNRDWVFRRMIAAHLAKMRMGNWVCLTWDIDGCYREWPFYAKKYDPLIYDPAHYMGRRQPDFTFKSEGFDVPMGTRGMPSDLY